MSTQISRFSRWSMLLGNLFEHYDAALYTMLSPFLAPLFFPNKDLITSLIWTFSIIPLGMIARPFGSLVFGYIGDTRGRKEALVLALSGMAIATAFLGFLPTYGQVGFLAPILLSIGRIFQNFFAAGETMGGSLYLIENAPESQKDITSGIYNASTIAGILLASFGVSILYWFDIVQTGWRILYFLGCSTALFALFLRAKMSFQPHKSPSRSSLKFVLKSCWVRRQALLSIAVASGFSYACYTLALVLMNSFVPLVTNITTAEMMHLNTFLLVVDFMLLPLFGLLAGRYSRDRMMMLSGILAVITGLPLFWYLQGASLIGVICIRLCLVVIGVWFSAPFHAWAQQLVPPPQRYTVLSLGYALGSQILGGPSAVISLWLFQKTNWVVSVGFYWMFLGLLASYLISRQEVASFSRNLAPAYQRKNE